MVTRYKEIYDTKVVPELKKQFNYANVHQVPRIEKIVLNMGVGEVVTNAKAIEFATQDMTLISGQKPSIRKSKKSIANFKLREGIPIGVTVTLRGVRMYEFLDRLLSIAIPRVRDFRGIPKNGFDGRGNYSLGLNEQIIFPEIDIEKTVLRGLSVTFVTTANTNEEGKALLTHFGFPFRA